MCEKNEDLQKVWKPKKGDWVKVIETVKWDGYNECSNASDITTILGISDSSRHYDYISGKPVIGDVNDYALYPEGGWVSFDCTEKENLIWLPTQEQLQEILYDCCRNKAKILECFQSVSNYMIIRFSEFIYRDKNRDFDFNCSWLAFVMHELYNKIWTGKDWKTIEGGKLWHTNRIIN